MSGSKFIHTVALSTVVLAALAACTNTAQVPIAPQTSSPASASDANAYPVTFDASAQTEFPEENVQDLVMTDSLLITMTPSQVTARTVPDLAEHFTRTPINGQYVDLWLDPDGTRLFALETLSASGSGTDVGTDNYTIQVFDLTEGDVLSTTTFGVTKSIDDPAPAAGKIVGVSADTLLLDTWPSAGDSPAHTSIAATIGAEQAQWVRPRSRLLAATDRTVVLADLGRRSAVLGLAPTTGKVLWRRLPGTTAAHLVGGGDARFTISRAAGPNTQRLYRVVADSGQIKSLGRDRTGALACQSTDRVAVCSGGDPYQVVAYHLWTGRKLWELPTARRYAPVVTLVAGDRVYGGLGSGQGVVLDAETGADYQVDTALSPVAVAPAGGALLYGGRAFFVPPVAGSDVPAPSPAPTKPTKQPTKKPSRKHSKNSSSDTPELPSDVPSEIPSDSPSVPAPASTPESTTSTSRPRPDDPTTTATR